MESSIFILLPFLALMLSATGCKPGGEQEQQTAEQLYIANNPTEFTFSDVGFQLTVSDSVSVFHQANNQWLAVQYDDLNGDGQIDECFWLTDVKAHSTASFRLGPAEKAIAAPKRIQVVFKTQDRDFSTENAQAITADYIQRPGLIVPPLLSPQNKWAMFEGPVWENEQIAYRFYLDNRQRNDIYGKKVSSLVMDTVGWDYHNIMDWGSDILKVGESLGLGSPALWWNGEAYALGKSAKKEVKVLANGPLRTIIRINFTGLEIDSFQLNLTCDLKMQAGHNWTEVHLQSETPLPEGMKFATGIVKLLPDIQTGDTGDVQYFYNWGPQSFHNQGLGMGILAKNESKPRLQTTGLDHLVILEGSRQVARYRFIAAWDQGPELIRSAESFAGLLEQESQLWTTRFSLEKTQNQRKK